MDYMFRDLTADEVECRIGMLKQNGLTLLLYKDARCDMNILDETIGAMNWKKGYTRDNANCIVSIWDDQKKEWIPKEDTGTESNTEKEKGIASDSFKRSCVNWGIGRELYTSPFIWIPSAKCNIKDGKCYDKFEVTHLVIENKKIVELKIANTTLGIECFNWSKNGQIKQENVKDEKVSDQQAKTIYKALLRKLGSDDIIIEYLSKKYDIENTSDLMKSQYVEIINEFKGGKNEK